MSDGISGIPSFTARQTYPPQATFSGPVYFGDNYKNRWGNSAPTLFGKSLTLDKATFGGKTVFGSSLFAQPREPRLTLLA